MENTNKDKTKEINQRGRGNIALLGFMGSGKTTIGQQLAQKVGWQFMDTDDLIEEKTSLSISLIFERWGEEHFRCGTRRSGFKKEYNFSYRRRTSCSRG